MQIIAQIAFFRKQVDGVRHGQTMVLSGSQTFRLADTNLVGNSIVDHRFDRL